MKAVIVNIKTPNPKRFPGYTAAYQALDSNKIYFEGVDYTLGKPIASDNAYWLNFQPSHSTPSIFLSTDFLPIDLSTLSELEKVIYDIK